MAVDRDKILQAAQKLVDRKRYDKAIVEYRKLVADDPGDVRTLLKIGDLHLKLEQHEQAIATYEQVGEYYQREGFAVKAIAVYKQIRGIITRHAPHLEARYGHILPRLAEIYVELGLTSDALAAFDEVATRLRQEGRERDALDVFKKVVALDPQNPIAHLRVADSRARLGDTDKAVDAFGEAARIMLQLGRRDDTIKVLERLLEYRPVPSYALLCARTYLDRGQPHDGMAALSKLQIAFKANPRDLDTLDALARAFDAIEQPRKAIEVLKEAARIARDRNDQERLARVVEQLEARAGDDLQVKHLLEQLRGPATPDSAETIESEELVSVEEVSVEEAELSTEEIEVFELDEAEIEAISSDQVVPPWDPLEVPENEAAAVWRLSQDAEAHRAAGNLDAAIDLLRRGILGVSQAASRQLRQSLSDLLLERGDPYGAIQEKLLLARELAAEGAVDHANRLADEALLVHPGDPAALHLKAELGHPVPAHLAYPHGATPDPPGAYLPPHGHPGYPVDPWAPAHSPSSPQGESHQPMPSYDLESGGVDEVLQRTSSRPVRSSDAPYSEAPYSDPGYGERSVPATSHAVPSSRYGPDSAPHGVSSGRRSHQSAAPHERGATGNDIADSDAQTHYDLGVAYMEMGLYADAIGELNMASRDPAREIVCLSMITNIHLQVGNLDGALDALHRALSAPHKSSEQELQIGYEIANTYELKGMADQALRYFEWLLHFDPDYPDPRGTPTERIAVLRRTKVGSKS